MSNHELIVDQAVDRTKTLYRETIEHDVINDVNAPLCHCHALSTASVSRSVHCSATSSVAAAIIRRTLVSPAVVRQRVDAPSSRHAVVADAMLVHFRCDVTTTHRHRDAAMTCGKRRAALYHGDNERKLHRPIRHRINERSTVPPPHPACR